MTFIRASKRLPPTDNHYHGKVDGIKRIINFYQQNGVNYCYVSNSYSIHQDYFDTVWWLEEEQWISCEPGNPLPDYDQPVLWITKSGNYHVYTMDKDESFETVKTLFSFTHWRKLPEPPETKKELS